ncbi:Piso0_005023 [Millerozyma farinosa CBS 7064]|uniref:Piso0_005023 protein n=1 Tax=Pichia sorbitophila (strain ATCC MYA-4447 / BCRC 22081 / CBS 7064 / NBRC 10061 / NRRL Y-12695) TaxID=559304 RepID=G8Y409_PICSO|nr:Piso0_005023 [Millerozyma farinosa CBS 7064]
MSKRALEDNDSSYKKKTRHDTNTVLAAPGKNDQTLDDIKASEQTINSTKADNTYYLDTIDRSKLDFDFEKVCSVTLSNVNVYCCLVCGTFLQGRSKSSPAYLHSINSSHRIFLNLHTEKFFILPDNYELSSNIVTRHLDDIRLLLNPRYDIRRIKELSTKVFKGYDLRNHAYDVGFIGLNNIQNNDYANVTIQALSHIVLIRDFYLSLSLEENQSEHELVSRKSVLNHNFEVLLKKLWSQHLFKNHVSPHEFLQVVSSITSKKFSTTSETSPKDFLVWLLNRLHSDLVKTFSRKRSILSKTLQGNVEVITIPIEAKTNEYTLKVDFSIQEEKKSSKKTNYWMLSLDLPPDPLFKNSVSGKYGNEIPQVSIFELLKKYNGTQTVQSSSTELRSYKLLEPLPPYIILFYDRGIEEPGKSKRGNPTVVKFPLEIDFSEYLEKPSKSPLNYRLISNIKHESSVGTDIERSIDKEQWSIDLRKSDTDEEWTTIRDLEIERCNKELMFLSECYLQIWERC